MNWDTIVEQLGWQEVVSKWESAEARLTDCVGDCHTTTQEVILDTIPKLSKEHSKSDSIENLNSFTRSKTTNPFFNCDESELEVVAPPPQNTESWFYIDPHDQEQGPFDADKMAVWYDAGYFDDNVNVRKACECEHTTIGDLIERSAIIFPTVSASDLIPLEYVERANSFINPFRLKLVDNCEEIRKTETSIRITPYMQECYSSDISGRLKDLNLHGFEKDGRPQTRTRNPIKFNFAEMRLNKCGKESEKWKDVNGSKISSKDNFVLKLDSLQKYWRNVANSKLFGPQRAQLISLELNGEQFDAFLESSSRVSCLGADSIDFLNKRNIQFTQYRNPTRTIKTENGGSAKIIGHAFITLSYATKTISEFKLLVIPDLNAFLHLGTDFRDKFAVDEVPMPPRMYIERSKKYCDDGVFHILQTSQIHSLNRIKQSFSRLIFPRIRNLRLTALEFHHIDLIESRTPLQIPAICLEANSLNLKVLDWMLTLDIIEEQKFTSRFPATVSYKQGELQLAINLQLRKINLLIKHDEHTLVSKTDILKKVRNANYISSIQLGNISGQILLDVESRKLLTFEIAGHGCYQFKRVPVGLKNGPHRIDRIMNKIFPTQWRGHWVLNSNELLILSQDFDSHIKYLEEIRKLIDESGIEIDVQKSKFCVSKIKCLGYIVGSETQRTDPEAYKDISSISRPPVKKQLVSFLKLIEWYRTLLPSYDKLVAPLRLLEHSRTEDEKLVYSPEACEAFSSIKRFLMSDNALQEPNFKLPFYVQSNASFRMVAGMLYQVGIDGRKRAVAYYAKELTAAQKKYSVTELECFALVSSLKLFQSYVDGEHFYVVSDENILSWILNQPQLPTRLSSWCMTLHNYNITIVQRQFIGNDSCEPSVFNRPEASFKYKIINGLMNASFQDYEELRDQIIRYPNNYPDHRIQNDLIFCRRAFSCGDPIRDKMVWKLYIPAEMGKSIVECVHVNGFGDHRTRKEMKRFLQTELYWPSMGAEIQKVIKNCRDC